MPTIRACSRSDTLFAKRDHLLPILERLGSTAAARIDRASPATECESRLDLNAAAEPAAPGEAAERDLQQPGPCGTTTPLA